MIVEIHRPCWVRGPKRLVRSSLVDETKTCLRQLGSLLRFLELLLGLAILGEVDGCNLLCLLDLQLVGLDLGLQLVGQLGHAVLVLLVLLLGEEQFLNLALGALEGLHVLGGAALQKKYAK